MRLYVQVTGVVFAVGAVAQLARAVFALPLRIGEVQVPVWCSAVASIAGALMALWAMRIARGSAT